MTAALRELREAPADIPDCDIRALVDTLLAADREAEAWAQQHPAEEAAPDSGEAAQPAESESTARAYELFERANSLEADGDYDAAARLLEEACRLESSDAFLVSLTRVYIHAGRRDAAVGSLDRLLDALGEGFEKRDALQAVREALAAEDEPIPDERREGLVDRLSEAYAP
jgi:tetratricopeptide (TPR) repeat protein